MNYITDLTFAGSVFVILTFAIVIMLQMIKALSTAVSIKMRKRGDKY